MMMEKSRLQAAFQAVLGDPDADEPRLSFATACEAAGDPELGEFIRLQIDLTAKKRAGQNDWTAGIDRMYQLEDRNHDRWAGPIQWKVARVQFFRGFVEKITIDAATFLATADELYRLAPIRRLVLTGVVPVIDELFQSPHLARIVWLSLEREKIGDRGVEILAASPYLGNLKYLNLATTGVTAAGIETLAASSRLPSLRELGFPTATESYRELLWDDQGRILNAFGSPDALRLEERYGRKAWLHTIEDNRLLEVYEDEL